MISAKALGDACPGPARPRIANDPAAPGRRPWRCSQSLGGRATIRHRRARQSRFGRAVDRTTSRSGRVPLLAPHRYPAACETRRASARATRCARAAGSPPRGAHRDAWAPCPVPGPATGSPRPSPLEIPDARRCPRLVRIPQAGSRSRATSWGPRDCEELLHTSGERQTTSHLSGRGKREPHALVPVLELEARLDHAVVGREERCHPRGVARAPGALEQERVVERGPVVRAQPDFVAQPHADDTRPQRMPRRLPLRQVERVRQRREHFGETDMKLPHVRGGRTRRQGIGSRTDKGAKGPV